jgi:hypothetical protein
MWGWPCGPPAGCNKPPDRGTAIATEAWSQAWLHARWSPTRTEVVPTLEHVRAVTERSSPQ